MVDSNERRLSRRVPVQCELAFMDAGDQTRYLGMTRNISSGGLLFTTDYAARPGAQLEVQVSPGTSSAAPLHALVEVLWVQSLPGPARFELGCAIRRVLG